jgi:CheY-like chemotaxis protein
MTTSPPTRILLVDDQDDIRLLWRLAIEAANHNLQVVAEAASGVEAIAHAGQADVLVVDQMMPGMTGLELVEELRARGRTPVIILCSAYLSREIIARAREVGVARCLPKDRLRDLPDAIRTVTA